MVEKVDFIKEDLIFSLLEKGKITDRNEIREILAKARECKGISLGEVAKLLYLEDEELLEELYDVAKYIKTKYTEKEWFCLLLYIQAMSVQTTAFTAVSGMTTKSFTERL